MADLPPESYKFEGFLTGAGKDSDKPGIVLCSAETPVDPELYEEHTRRGDIELEFTITRTVREDFMHRHVLCYSFDVVPASVASAIDELSRTRNEEWSQFIETCFKLAQGRFLDRFPQELPPRTA